MTAVWAESWIDRTNASQEARSLLTTVDDVLERRDAVVPSGTRR